MVKLIRSCHFAHFFTIGVDESLTNLGESPTLIARQVCWSPDGRYLYAAVAENGADIVMCDGLILGLRLRQPHQPQCDEQRKCNRDERLPRDQA